MLKKIGLYIIVFTCAGTISFLHKGLVPKNSILFGELLNKTYLFHGLFSFALVLIFTFLSKNRKLFEQLGFIYIGLLVFKIMLFVMMAYEELLGEVSLPAELRAHLLLPVFLFVFLEVFFLIKILREKPA